jgi:plasmid stability protein
MRTVVLELPADLYEKLRRSAAKNNRTVQAEAVHLLQQVLDDDPKPTAVIPAPCDLQLPDTGVRFPAKENSPGLPDPSADL